MERARRGFSNFITSINTENVQRESLAMNTARDLLQQVAEDKLSREGAIEKIVGIKDEEKSALTLDYFEVFEMLELGRTSSTL